MSSPLRRLFYNLRGLEIISTVTNPTDLWLSKLGIPRKIRLRNDLEISVDRSHYPLARKLVWLSFYGAPLSFEPKPGYWTVDLDQDRLSTPGGIAFVLSRVGDPFVLAETFVYGVHFAGFNLAGRTVVDAGANIGDTALYYASQGARVFAYEPDPDNYATLTENLRRNPGLHIEARPLAVGMDGTVTFHAGLHGGSGIYARGGRPISVTSRSLKSILEEEKISDPYLLKADCKGAEFELVQQEAIGRFEQVLIEFDAPREGRGMDFLLGELRSRGFAQLRVFKHNWWVSMRTVDHCMIHAEH